LNYTNGRRIEAVCLQEGFKLLGRGNYHGVRGLHYAHIADCIVTQEYVDALVVLQKLSDCTKYWGEKPSDYHMLRLKCFLQHYHFWYE
jgi:hypothetical protein